MADRLRAEGGGKEGGGICKRSVNSDRLGDDVAVAGGGFAQPTDGAVLGIGVPETTVAELTVVTAVLGEATGSEMMVETVQGGDVVDVSRLINPVQLVLPLGGR